MKSLQEALRLLGVSEVGTAYNLDAKIYIDRVCIKYNMIRSDFSSQVVREARGAIFSLPDFRYLSRPFTKFFNLGESHCARIDWTSARVLEKLDGTMIQLYHDGNEWCIGTTGTAFAEGMVGVHSFTFADMTKSVIPDLSSFDKQYTYLFELTGPENQVVVPYTARDLYFLGCINKLTGQEIIPEMLPNSIKYPKQYQLTDLSASGVKALADTLPWNEEGYVVVDKYFNRVKVKSPAYVAVHHMRGKTSDANLIATILSGELDELGVYFPDMAARAVVMLPKINVFKQNVQSFMEQLVMPKNISKEERKRFAGHVFALAKELGLPQFATSIAFQIADGKEININDLIQSDHFITYIKS